MTPRRAIVTCGPAIAPIDGVRRITNFATGEIGSLLTEQLARRGWDVLCMRAEGSTSPSPGVGTVAAFSTNNSLLAALKAEAGRADAILQAAALCDYEPVLPGADQRKLRSEDGPLTLTLRPATKLLPLLRGLFPRARILGWKYELDGSADDALARARSQITNSHTDACVLNGPAFRAGFGLVGRTGQLEIVWSDKQATASGLAEWLDHAGPPNPIFPESSHLSPCHRPLP